MGGGQIVEIRRPTELEVCGISDGRRIVALFFESNRLAHVRNRKLDEEIDSSAKVRGISLTQGGLQKYSVIVKKISLWFRAWEMRENGALER